MSSAADAPTEEPAARDEAREEALATLQRALGDGVLDSHLRPGVQLTVRVARDSWVAAGEAAHDELGCAFFDFLSAVDWLPSPFGRGEDDPTEPAPERSTEIVPGLAGGDTRFQLLAHVRNVRTGLSVVLKADVPDDDLSVPTWVGVYAGANWHERQVAEAYGIDFAGHPHLVKLYLPGGFEGFPGRKDFPLLARLVKPWPGIVDVEPMPGGGDEEEDPAS